MGSSDEPKAAGRVGVPVDDFGGVVCSDVGAGAGDGVAQSVDGVQVGARPVASRKAALRLGVPCMGV
jgi:hypothetical protein